MSILESENTNPDLTLQITKRAYELYEQRSRQDGHADQDWHQSVKDIEKNRPHK